MDDQFDDIKDKPFFDLGAPEGLAPQPETAERPDIELYLDQLAELRDTSTRELIARRSYWKGEIESREKALKAAQLAATPDKWPGSNEGERNIAREKAMLADKLVAQSTASLSMARYQHDLIEAEMDARDSERKQAEFDLRKREANLRERDLVLREAELESLTRIPANRKPAQKDMRY